MDAPGPTIVLVKPFDGTSYKCPMQDCPRGHVERNLRSVRCHVKNCHPGFIARKYRAEDKKARRAATHRRQYEKKKAKKVPLRARQCKKKISMRDAVTIDDVKRGLGIHGHKRCTLEVKTSTIPNSGNGVFTKTKICKGDVVTVYSGNFIPPDKWSKAIDQQYCIALAAGAGWIDGIKSPVARQGYGSLINRAAAFKDKNCEFVNESKQVTVVAVKNIKAGKELFVTYGHAYRLPK